MSGEELPAGVRRLACLEVTRPCGCVVLLTGKRATVSAAKRLAAGACYSCKLKGGVFKRKKGGEQL